MSGLVQFRVRGPVYNQGPLIAWERYSKCYPAAIEWGWRRGPSASPVCRSQLWDPMLLSALLAHPGPTERAAAQPDPPAARQLVKSVDSRMPLFRHPPRVAPVLLG